MKKVLLATIAGLMLTACSATTHKGIEGAKFSDDMIESRPMQVSVVPGEKIQGSARCRSFLFFTLNAPEREAYGAQIQTNDGNFEAGNCTRGAVYDAISKGKADVLLAPQYTASGKTFGCLFGHCLYSDSTVEVVGYKGTFKDIKEMPEEVIKERFKNAEKEKPSALPGGFSLPF